MIKKRFALVLAVMMLFSITMNFSVSAGSDVDMIEVEACSSAHSDEAFLNSCVSRSCYMVVIIHHEIVKCPTHCRCDRIFVTEQCIICFMLRNGYLHTNPSMGHSMFSPAAGVWICRTCGYGG
jgi:hypothetical protein